MGAKRSFTLAGMILVGWLLVVGPPSELAGARPAGVTGARLGRFRPVGARQVRELASGIQAFGVALYRELTRTQGNAFFSPWSVSMAFGMIRSGAADPSASQMDAVFHYPRSRLDARFATLLRRLGAEQGAGIRLELANRIFVQKGFRVRRSYERRLARYYGAGCQPVDFAHARDVALGLVNGWVRRRTRGRIRRLLTRSDVTSETVLVLVNAIFFDGRWATGFDERDTKPRPFFVASSRKILVPTMMDQREAGYAEGPDFQALSLDYKGGRFDFVVLLPRRKDGLGALERKLTAQWLRATFSRLEPRVVRIFLPRLHLRRSMRLESALKRLGLVAAFCGSGLRGQFPGMTRGGDLCIFRVAHAADCHVDEEGTVAAAATAGVMQPLSADLGPARRIPTFRADHPFLFLVRHKPTGTLLFMGRVARPQSPGSAR